MSFLSVKKSFIAKGISLPVVAFGILLSCLSGYLLRWTLHILIYRLSGLFLGVLLALSIYSFGMFYRPVSRWSGEFNRINKNPLLSLQPFAFLDPEIFVHEKLELKPNKDELKEPIYPGSFIVSESLDVMIEFIIRDFILTWYNRLSKDEGRFPSSVDGTIRYAVKEVKSRLIKIDFADFLIGRIVPLIDSHFTQFTKADATVRNKASKYNLTQTNELDIAVAREFNGGKLHPAVALKQSNFVSCRKKWLSQLVGKLVPYLLPESERGSLVVMGLIREIIVNNILLPALDPFCNQDTWNQLIVKVALPTMQDRKQVQRVLAALDEHTTVAGILRAGEKNSVNRRILKLTPNADQTTFDRFIRQIKKTQSLAEARQIRYYISVQLERAMNERLSRRYINYLQNANDVINEHISSALSTSAFLDSTEVAVSSHSAKLRTQEFGDISSLDDILENPSCLQSFMEFVDQRNHTVTLQFILTVKAIRDPLETVSSNGRTKLRDLSDSLENSSDEIRNNNRNSDNYVGNSNDCDRLNGSNDNIGKNITDDIADDYDSTDDDDDDYRDDDSFSINKNQNDYTNREEISAIYLSYFLNQPQLSVSQRSLDAVKTYLDSNPPSKALYRKARKAILRTQLVAIRFLQESHLVEFKKSDLYLKYKASAGNQSTQWSKQSRLMINTKSDILSKPNSSSENSKVVETLRALTGSPVSIEGASDRKTRLAPRTRTNEKVLEDVEAAFKDIMHKPKNFLDDMINTKNNSSSALDTETNGLSISRTNKLFDSSDDEFESDLEESLSNLRDRKEADDSSHSDILENFKELKKDISEQTCSEDEDENYELHHASPGDLGLAEVIESLSNDIDRLFEKEEVLAPLLRKAELTNNTIDLRILRKSKSSLDREIHRKELQRQQYIVQKNDNSLFGRSSISIQGYVNGSESGHEYTLYIIQVQRFNLDGSISAGWVVARRYKQFLRLHQHLKSLFPSVNDLNFPKKNLIVKFQVKSFINERKEALEVYLKRLLEIPQVCNSKAFRDFLSSETFSDLNSDSGIMDDSYEVENLECSSKSDLQPSAINHSKSLTQDFFSKKVIDSSALGYTDSFISSDSGGLSSFESNLSEVEAEINSVESIGSSIDMVSRGHSFIQPICDIFIKIFGLEKGHSWLRGRAVVVVIQQLLGGTIERKIRDLTASLVTEKTLLEIIQQFQDNLWPDGIFKRFNPNVPPPAVRTNGDIVKTKREANLLLESLIIELCSKVVGGSNARYAANRLFCMLQNPLLDAQLTFGIFEEILGVLFPEIKDT